MLRNTAVPPGPLRELLDDLVAEQPDAGHGVLQRLAESGVEARDADAPEAWHRWQDPIIETLTPEGASVLDLGCGDGVLLARLTDSRRICAQGVELNQDAVLRCVERGVPVFNGNLDEGLRGFPDRSFQVVILEQTLQTLHRPTRVLEEMLRVGRKAFVSFPNFAHWRVRHAFAVGGFMPVTRALPHTWYDTPNIHLCSIRDFVRWAAAAGVSILDAYVFADGTARQLRQGDSLQAEDALFLLEKAEAG